MEAPIFDQDVCLEGIGVAGIVLLNLRKNRQLWFFLKVRSKNLQINTDIYQKVGI